MAYAAFLEANGEPLGVARDNSLIVWGRILHGEQEATGVMLVPDALRYATAARERMDIVRLCGEAA